MTARITVGICTHDRYHQLPQAIDSVLGQRLSDGEFHVLVIDNSPDAAGARAFAGRYAGVDHLTYVVEETPGVSNARNVAVSACRTELLAFIDDDAVAAPGWLERILHAFDVFGADAAAVGGKVVPVFGEADRAPESPDEVVGDRPAECPVRVDAAGVAGVKIVADEGPSGIGELDDRAPDGAGVRVVGAIGRVDLDGLGARVDDPNVSIASRCRRATPWASYGVIAR